MAVIAVVAVVGVDAVVDVGDVLDEVALEAGGEVAVAALEALPAAAVVRDLQVTAKLLPKDRESWKRLYYGFSYTVPMYSVTSIVRINRQLVPS